MTFEAIVLAAGRGSRAGGFKHELDCGGLPLLVRTVQAFTSVCRRTWVVTGFRSHDVARLVGHLPAVALVANPDWEQGMFSSVARGARRVTSDRFFVVPGDLPLLNSELVSRLTETAGDVVVPTFGGRRGHPVLLDRRWLVAIGNAQAGARLNELLAAAAHTEIEMDDDAVLRDIDTCQDYVDYQRRTVWPQKCP